MPTKNPLIVALDTSSSLKALNLVSKLKVTGVAFKIGFELFMSAGPKVVEKIISHDVRVFLDLKLHDIPNTVAHAARVATQMGVWMFNVHASGGPDMMKAAKEASLEVVSKSRVKTPKLIAVTVLTSLKNIDFLQVKPSIADQVVHLAQLTKECGLDGVVASAQEAASIRNNCGADFAIVTPGIRMAQNDVGDQGRILSPKEAMQNGSHYLVVGRPITQSSRPLKAVDEILQSL